MKGSAGARAHGIAIALSLHHRLILATIIDQENADRHSLVEEIKAAIIIAVIAHLSPS